MLKSRSQLEERPFSDEEHQHIRSAIRRKYLDVAQSAEGLFSYPTGKKGALALGYDPAVIDRFPEEALNSFCGVGNPFAISSIPAGSKVLDIGCGAGFDLLVAREIVGDKGEVCGIDLTEEMVAKAISLIQQYGDETISVTHVSSEEIPFADDSFDYVISNGVINLSPAKLELFKQIRRVLKPGAILQFADVCLQEGIVPNQESNTDDWAQ